MNELWGDDEPKCIVPQIEKTKEIGSIQNHDLDKNCFIG